MMYIGIDLGTSAAKLLLCDENGKILNIISKSYPVYYPKNGYSEQNPGDWLAAVKSGIKELLDGFDSSKVKGIGAGGQMHGLVVLDENDEVIRPAILWNDSRSAPQTDYLNGIVGTERLSEYTANIAFAGFTAPKILWMKQNEPHLFSRVKKIMLPKDYINYMLSGVFSTDVSDASGMLLFDVKNRCWSKEITAICGIFESMLPTVYESFEKTGVLLPDVAKDLGLGENVAVCAGAGDNAAAAVGCGAVAPGSCNISIGTSGTVFIPSDSCVCVSSSLHSFAHANGKYHLMGCILSAASCLSWWNESILQTSDYDAVLQEINSSSLPNNNVFFLPYLTGERSPHNDPFARGAFIGLSPSVKREDMTEAVLEGVAFAIKDCVEIARSNGISIEKSMICGGGSKSALWRRIFADVLEIPLLVPETEQGPGFGAAILSMVSCGEYESVEDAAGKLVKTKETVSPNSISSERYKEKYHHWKSFYPALKNSF